MYTSRLKELLEYINKNTTVSLSELSTVFSVSGATIRRDVARLDEMGMVERFHGIVKSKIYAQRDEPPYDVRVNMYLEEKIRISENAFQSINDGDSIFLDSSTTVLELAKLLSNSNKNITVITNDIQIAYILSPHPVIDLVVVGGTIRKGYYTSIGFLAENLWKDLYADKLFLGVDAISPQLGMMNYRVEELPCKKLMLSNSKYHTVLCDHTKFSTSAVLKICDFADIDLVITGTELDASIISNIPKNIMNIVMV